MSQKFKGYGTFFLTLISIIGSLALAFSKDVDVSILLPSLLGIYVGVHGGVKASNTWAASKDQNADTNKVISENSDKF